MSCRATDSTNLYCIYLQINQNRSLVKDKANSPVGSITLWIDIMTKQDSLKYPPVSISGPEKLKFEIRVVVWKSIGVKVPGNRFLDMFCQCNMDGDSYTPVTDTHWRNKTGAASWNWRLKIPIELPLNARERARLRVRMFNRSVIINNVEVGSNSIDLFDWLMIAYKRKTQVVTPYLEIRSEMKKRNFGNFRRADEDEEEESDDDDDNSGDEEESGDGELVPGMEADDDDTDELGGGAGAGRARSQASGNSSSNSKNSIGDDDDVNEDDSAPLLANDGKSSSKGSGGSIEISKLNSEGENAQKKKKKQQQQQQQQQQQHRKYAEDNSDEKVANAADAESEDEEELNSLLKSIRVGPQT